MHRRGADLLEAALDGLAGRRVLVLGLTYRPGVRETAYSPALALARELTRRGATVLGHDPLLGPDELSARGLTPMSLTGQVEADAVALHTADPAYAGLDLARFPGLRAVLDSSGAIDPARAASAGADYLAIGRPGTAIGRTGARR
jgi:UDP-N-acetyl-D-glucosamine dehydrogenase